MSAKGEKLTREFENKCINTIRVLAADMVQGAKSGHPGAPMGCAPMAHTLFGKVMRFNPKNPEWFNRDRFILSNGHACALQYCMLHLTGYDLSMQDLQHFRQLNSRTPGHPENFLTPGIEVSTGPLGQGISNAVGIALAEAQLSAVFNRPGYPIIDHYTYVICGDGCLQEGISAEAGSLAGHLRLGKLIVLYDDNSVTIDGPTRLSFTEDVLARYAAYGWHTSAVDNGDDDYAGIAAAIQAARDVSDKPSIIKIHTTIGFGSGQAGSAAIHGAPLGEEDLAGVKARFGFDPTQRYVVPANVRQFYDRSEAGGGAEGAWQELFERYADEHPDLAAQLRRRMAGQLSEGWKAALPHFAHGEAAEKATRQWSAAVLNALVPSLPELIGGSADLTPSTLTQLSCSHDFTPEARDGRYVRFGVREHAMAAICNGIAAHGGLIPFASTFLNFAGYALGAIRLSSLSRFRVLYIMTHDSIGLGEDGPTHQPIEMLAALRALPNMLVFRPADGNEVAGSYAAALSRPHTPSTIALSRQPVPVLAGSCGGRVEQGGYTLQDHDNGAVKGVSEAPDLILTGTGSEVSLLADAAPRFAGKRVRVVSLPCTELFDAQPLAYRLTVFPPGVPVLGVEAGAVHGWEKYSHAQIGIVRFGSSAPYKALYPYFGFTADNIVTQGERLIDFYNPAAGRGPAPSLLDRMDPNLVTYTDVGH